MFLKIETSLNPGNVNSFASIFLFFLEQFFMYTSVDSYEAYLVCFYKQDKSLILHISESDIKSPVF